MSRILVTGGAGYIGSHIVRELSQAGEDVVVIDNLCNGHREAIGEVPLVEADFADPAALDRVFGRGDVDAVIHMAAFCEVGASMNDPGAYYDNNVRKSLALLDAAVKHGVRGVVFSSSAATYGDPVELPITEDHPQRPTNPYGETKLVFERALGWYCSAYRLGYVALRYFNAAGAHPDGDLGEHHDPESHLVPRLIRSAATGGEPTPIFGTDWETRDGTCVRDYVHVVDLAQAHVQSVRLIRDAPGVGEAVNLGNGEGFTVREVVDAVEQEVGRRPPTEDAPRRPGDPAQLVASAERAGRVLGWRPRFPALGEIVGSAWRWHQAHPGGYSSDC